MAEKDEFHETFPKLKLLDLCDPPVLHNNEPLIRHHCTYNVNSSAKTGNVA